MAVAQATVSLVVRSASMTSDEIRARLDVEPTSVWDDAAPVGRRPPHGLVIERTSTAPDQGSLNEAAAALLVALAGRAATIQSLRPDCEVDIWAMGDSDSTQGGFWLDPTVLAGLAECGATFYVDVFLTDADADV